MAVLNTVPPPFGDQIAQKTRPGYKPGTDPLEGLMSTVWIDYFSGQTDLTEKFPARVYEVALIGQTDTIPATDMTNGNISAGVYRIGWFLYLKVEDAGGKLDLSFGWSTDSVALSKTVALVTDQVENFESGSLPLLYIDGLSPVTYAVVYTPSSGGLVYNLRIVVEELHA